MIGAVAPEARHRLRIRSHRQIFTTATPFGEPDGNAQAVFPVDVQPPGVAVELGGFHNVGDDKLRSHFCKFSKHFTNDTVKAGAEECFSVVIYAFGFPITFTNNFNKKYSPTTTRMPTSPKSFTTAKIINPIIIQ